MATSKVTLKLLIDTKNNKVIFAESGKDFVDFLFNLMVLPLGTVTGLLETNGMTGCVGDLYESIQNLNQTYIEEGKDKNSLLKPTVRSDETPMLFPNIKSFSPELYLCSKGCCSGMYAVNDPNAPCFYCCQKMSLPVHYESFVAKNNETKRNSGGVSFVKGVVTYMVMDNLEVSPVSAISSVSLLSKIDLNAVEEKVVEFGMSETKSVLTRIFLKKEDCQVSGSSKKPKRG